jgi:phage terminase large subunit
MKQVVDIQVSPIYEWNRSCKKPIIIHQGGTSSGKTYNILIDLFCKASEISNLIITVVGQDVPALKAGALRDAEKIWRSSPAFEQQVVNYNKTDRIFLFANGSIMEFKSFKDAQDAHNGKRHYLFINEAPGISYDIYQQLALRTSKQIIIDYNPAEAFWVHENIIPDTKNAQLFISDHRHNPFLDQSVRDKIEALHDKDIDLWKVYARGQTGKIEGLVFRNYEFLDRIPSDAHLVAGGLDWGYSADPTSLLLVYRYGEDKDLIIDELIYEKGLTNPQIVDRLNDFGIDKTTEIIADSSEPKSIAEINSYGYNLQGAYKGKDSIRNGIDILKRQKLYITNRSYGLKKEIKSYKWKVDRDGKSTNEPIGYMNHSIDALRYVALNKLTGQDEAKYHWR